MQITAQPAALLLPGGDETLAGTLQRRGQGYRVRGHAGLAWPYAATVWTASEQADEWEVA